MEKEQEDAERKERERKIKKGLKKILIIIIIPVILLTILLGAAYYFLTIDDGTYDEDDWSSTPYAAAEYTNDVTVNSDGTLSSSISAKDLWNKMLENNSRVDLYLDTPEELSKLMKAEIITKYPDTRQEPDEDIKWNDIIASDTLQGIIKFKRASSDGSTPTMIYANPDEFYGWIEKYCEDGDETAKNNALTHFTLSKNESVNSNNDRDTEANYEMDIQTNYSDVIVQAAKEVESPGKSLCQKWVRQVYARAGLGNVSYATAYQAFKNNCVSTRKDNIPIGAAVYGTGSGSTAGHVGIYIGKNSSGTPMVMDNVGTIKTSSLDEWISWQEKNPTAIAGEESGWLGWGWQAGSPTILGTGTTGNNENNSKPTTEQNNSNRESYSAVVATWEEIKTTITTDKDANVKKSDKTQYSMTTTNINYEEMVDKYIMPFDLLWALLVVGEDKNFVFELADLVYNSDIQITVHDSLTTNTDIDEWHYTQTTKAIVNATLTAKCNEQTVTSTIKCEHEPDPNTSDVNFVTTKKVETKTNTIDVALTKANVWIVDYQNNYTRATPTATNKRSTITHDDEKDYPKEPAKTGDSYSCKDITIKKQELEQEVKTSAIQADSYAKDNGTQTGTGMEEVPIEPPVYTVDFDETIKVEYFNKYIKIRDEVTNTVTTQKYTQGTPKVREKTDKETEEDNFVTIFNKMEYAKNRSNIRNVSSWLFEIIQTNESTADMIDLVKYLLYKATGRNYGVKEYDFEEYNASAFSGLTEVYGNSPQEKVWFSLRGAGYSENATAAVMGNIHCESGFDPAKIERWFWYRFWVMPVVFWTKKCNRKICKVKRQ